jgi:hypothetical protein
VVDKDILSERGRSLEDEYFRKRDAEIVEKMRKAAAAAETQAEIGKRTGIADPALLAELQSLGFTSETVGLLPLVPAVQVAWAEGGVTDAERFTIVKLARARGIAEASAADRQLSAWLDRRPSDELFAQATGLVGAILGSPAGGGMSIDDLVQQCEAVANASGGLLGVIGRVSGEERQLLASLTSALKGRKP